MTCYLLRGLISSSPLPLASSNTHEMYILSQRMLLYQCVEAQIRVVRGQKQDSRDDHLILGILRLIIQSVLSE